MLLNLSHVQMLPAMLHVFENPGEMYGDYSMSVQTQLGSFCRQHTGEPYGSVISINAIQRQPSKPSHKISSTKIPRNANGS